LVHYTTARLNEFIVTIATNYSRNGTLLVGGRFGWRNSLQYGLW